MALTASTSICAGQADQVDKDKEIAIKQYLKVAPAESMLNDAMIEYTKVAPPETRQLIEESFKLLDTKKITDAMVGSMKKHFTTSEINALTNFYASKDGKSVMRKMGAMQADILPVIQSEVAAALMKTYGKQIKPLDE